MSRRSRAKNNNLEIFSLVPGTRLVDANKDTDESFEVEPDPFVTRCLGATDYLSGNYMRNPYLPHWKSSFHSKETRPVKAPIDASAYLFSLTLDGANGTLSELLGVQELVSEAYAGRIPTYDSRKHFVPVFMAYNLEREAHVVKGTTSLQPTDIPVRAVKDSNESVTYAFERTIEDDFMPVMLSSQAKPVIFENGDVTLNLTRAFYKLPSFQRTKVPLFQPDIPSYGSASSDPPYTETTWQTSVFYDYSQGKTTAYDESLGVGAVFFPYRTVLFKSNVAKARVFDARTQESRYELCAKVNSVAVSFELQSPSTKSKSPYDHFYSVKPRKQPSYDEDDEIHPDAITSIFEWSFPDRFRPPNFYQDDDDDEAKTGESITADQFVYRTVFKHLGYSVILLSPSICIVLDPAHDLEVSTVVDPLKKINPTDSRLCETTAMKDREAESVRKPQINFSTMKTPLAPLLSASHSRYTMPTDYQTLVKLFGNPERSSREGLWGYRNGTTDDVDNDYYVHHHNRSKEYVKRADEVGEALRLITENDKEFDPVATDEFLRDGAGQTPSQYSVTVLLDKKASEAKKTRAQRLNEVFNRLKQKVNAKEKTVDGERFVISSKIPLLRRSESPNGSSQSEEDDDDGEGVLEAESRSDSGGSLASDMATHFSSYEYTPSQFLRENQDSWAYRRVQQENSRELSVSLGDSAVDLSTRVHKDFGNMINSMLHNRYIDVGAWKEPSSTDERREKGRETLMARQAVNNCTSKLRYDALQPVLLLIHLPEFDELRRGVKDRLSEDPSDNAARIQLDAIRKVKNTRLPEMDCNLLLALTHDYKQFLSACKNFTEESTIDGKLLSKSMTADTVVSFFGQYTLSQQIVHGKPGESSGMISDAKTFMEATSVVISGAMLCLHRLVFVTYEQEQDQIAKSIDNLEEDEKLAVQLLLSANKSHLRFIVAAFAIQFGYKDFSHFLDASLYEMEPKSNRKNPVFYLLRQLFLQIYGNPTQRLSFDKDPLAYLKRWHSLAFGSNALRTTERSETKITALMEQLRIGRAEYCISAVRCEPDQVLLGDATATTRQGRYIAFVTALLYVLVHSNATGTPTRNSKAAKSYWSNKQVFKAFGKM